MTDETPAPSGANPSCCAPSGAPGAIIRQQKNGKTRIVRTNGKRWSQESERIFLEHLAATCNVTASAEAAGFSLTTVYKRRMKHPGFAREWRAAVDQGYARLEAMMVEKASDSLRTAPIEGAGPAPEVSFNDALKLLQLHRAAARGGPPQNYRAREKAPDMDAVRASILRKIEAIERADARKKAAQA